MVAPQQASSVHQVSPQKSPVQTRVPTTWSVQQTDTSVSLRAPCDRQLDKRIVKDLSRQAVSPSLLVRTSNTQLTVSQYQMASFKVKASVRGSRLTLRSRGCWVCIRSSEKYCLLTSGLLALALPQVPKVHRVRVIADIMDPIRFKEKRKASLGWPAGIEHEASPKICYWRYIFVRKLHSSSDVSRYKLKKGRKKNKLTPYKVRLTSFPRLPVAPDLACIMSASVKSRLRRTRRSNYIGISYR